MIQLKNINITFQKPLVENGSISLSHGLITLVKGRSGSGKSSLLYLIGMISHQKDLDYNFDGIKIDDHDEMMASFRKEKIGYVFQDNSLIEHLSIQENLNLYAMVAGIKTNQESIKDLLRKVHLDNLDLDMTVSNISGGEKQRLAIACAIIKKPDLLILDEPTSALDHENMTSVMKLLQELKKQGLMILLTSHDEEVVQYCDSIYEIKDGKIVSLNNDFIDDQKMAPCDNKSLGFKFAVSYYLKYLKKHLLSQLLLFIICAFSISALALTPYFSASFQNIIQNQLDHISERDLYIEANEVISDEIFTSIKENPYTNSIYYFVEEYYESLMVNGLDKKVSFILQPFFEENELDKHAVLNPDIDQGIYLSKALAKKLKVDETLKISFGEYKDLDVKGVLDASVKNTYTFDQNVMYIPYNLMEIKNGSSLVVFADHYHHIDKLKGMVLDNYPDFTIKTKANNINHFDEVLQVVENFLPLINGFILVICFIFMFLIYSRYITNRKREMLILKVNGLSKKETLFVLIVEMIIQSIFIALIAMICSYFLCLGFGYVFNNEIDISWILMIFKIFMLALMFMLLPSLISTSSFNKINIAQLLRESD